MKYKNRILGKLYVFNIKAKRKKRKIVFVKVDTELSSGVIKTGTVKQFLGLSEEDFLKSSLKQAYVDFKYKEITLNFTYSPFINIMERLIFNQFFDISKNRKTKHKHGLNKYVNLRSKKPENSLASYLEKKLNYLHPEFEDWQKVFIFDEKGYKIKKGKAKSIKGYSLETPSTSAVVFSSRVETTLTHEVLHCMGLAHTFQKGAEYAFNKKKTENFMDYSSTRNKLYLWQWKKLNGYF